MVTAAGNVLSFEYAQTQCICFGGNWGCFEQCPAQAPQPGDMCGLPQGLPCTYGTTTCYCIMDQFFCN